MREISFESLFCEVGANEIIVMSRQTRRLLMEI